MLAESAFDFYELHGFMMWGAWGVLGLVQLLTNRYCKGGNGWRYTMWVHRICGTLMLLITFVMAFMALDKADWKVNKGVHEVLGVMILSFVALLVAGGIFNRSMM